MQKTTGKARTNTLPAFFHETLRGDALCSFQLHYTIDMFYSMSVIKVSTEAQLINPFHALTEIMHWISEFASGWFSKWRFKSKGRASFVNRNGAILHHDNGCPHTAQLGYDLVEGVVWENGFFRHILLTLILLIITCLGDYTKFSLVLDWHQEKILNTNRSHK